MLDQSRNLIKTVDVFKINASQQSAPARAANVKSSYTVPKPTVKARPVRVTAKQSALALSKPAESKKPSDQDWEEF